MSMYECMCICIHIRMYVCMWVCGYVYTCRSYTYFVFLCLCSKRIGDLKVIIVTVQDKGMGILSKEFVFLEIFTVTVIRKGAISTFMGILHLCQQNKGTLLNKKKEDNCLYTYKTITLYIQYLCKDIRLIEESLQSFQYWYVLECFFNKFPSLATIHIAKTIFSGSC